MRVFTFVTRLWLAKPVDEVFPFFADARNLEAITPPWLSFHVATPGPIEMGVGTLIDYKLRIRGLPMKWRTRINAWEPPHRFVDEQLRGPYRQWVHEHTFEPSDGGTLATDKVDYAVPGGALVNWLLVKRDVRTIFRYRETRLLEMFGGRALEEVRGARRTNEPRP